MAKAAGATKLSVDVLPVRITFHPPDNRKRDMDNCIGALKAAQDGVAMAINVNDNKWASTYAWGAPVRGGKVEMEFENGTDETV